MHSDRCTCELDLKSKACEVLIAVGKGRKLKETYHIFHGSQRSREHQQENQLCNFSRKYGYV